MSFEKQIRKILDSNIENIEIDLINRGVSDDDVEKLVALLKSYPNKEIKFLNLYCNDITNKGAKLLSELTNVININLDYNRIGNEGAKNLISNSKIRELNLSDNNITDVCVEFILQESKQVYLKLVKNKITQENLDKISNLIRDNYEKSKGNPIGFFQLNKDEKPPIQSEHHSKIQQPEIFIEELFKLLKKHNVEINDRSEIPIIMEDFFKQNKSFTF